MTQSECCPQCGSDLIRSNQDMESGRICSFCGYQLHGPDQGDSEMSERKTVSSPALKTAVTQWAALLDDESTPFTSIKPRPEEQGTAELSLNIRQVLKREPDSPPTEGDIDYTLGALVGLGGFGVVRQAKQISLERRVALKMPRSDRPINQHQLSQFYTEALVTGYLDHPGIVPVYELGRDQAGHIFYSMKLVRGGAWQDVMADKSEEENLDILLRICDTMAFVHSKGVIHRDLKPHNVLLGDFGEVYVVDWGLAASISPRGKAMPLTLKSAYAGTAAYMAPEMAKGELQAIGFCSDIYLLGAILYQIATGKPPHHGKNTLECIAHASQNIITPPEKGGELVSIALQAMSSKPEQRFRSVKDFQQALFAFKSHAESRILCELGKQSLTQAEARQSYDLFNKALINFEQAISLWPPNEEAADNMARAKREYARCALSRHDLDLASGQIDPLDPKAQEVATQIQLAQKTRHIRATRLKLAIRVSSALVVLVILILLTGLILVSRERNRAQKAENMAGEQRNLALQTLEKLVFDVNSQLDRRPAMKTLQKKILDQAIAGLNQVIKSAPEEDKADRSLAAAHQSMARIYYLTNHQTEALEHQQQTIAILHDLEQQKPVSQELKFSMARAFLLLGDIKANFSLGNQQAAQQTYQQAIELLADLIQQNPTDFEIRSALIQAYTGQGDCAADSGDYNAAKIYYQQGLYVFEQITATTLHSDFKSRYFKWELLGRLADSYYLKKDYEQALKLYQTALQEIERLNQDQLKNIPEKIESQLDFKRALGLSNFDLGSTYMAVQHNDTAAQLLKQALTIQKELVISDSTNEQYQRDLLVTHFTYGNLLSDQNVFGSAKEQFQEAQLINERLLELNPDNDQARRDRILCCNELGNICLELKQLDAAETNYQAGMKFALEQVQRLPDHLGSQTDLAISYTKLADLACIRKQFTQSQYYYDQALELLHQLIAQGLITKDMKCNDWVPVLEKSRKDCAP